MSDHGAHDAAPVAADYDRLADAYAERLYGELSGKPFDRELLAAFAKATGDGRVCDVGCGPGHVTSYLREHGCDAFGVDISPRMVELARTLNSGIEFRAGDLRDLPVEDGALAGAVCFYSLIHLEAQELAPALEHLRRKLRPDGRVLLAVHEGSETRTPGELWGIPVSLRFNFFTSEQVETALLEAGFRIDDVHRRRPYPDVEVATNRLYAVALADGGRSR